MTEAPRFNLMPGRQGGTVDVLLTGFPAEPSLEKFASVFEDVQRLLIAGYYVERQTQRDFLTDKIKVRAGERLTSWISPPELESQVRSTTWVAKVSFNSPLEIYIAIASGATSTFAAARGAVYLWKRYAEASMVADQAKVSRKTTEIAVQLIELIDDAVPTLEEERAAVPRLDRKYDYMHPLVRVVRGRWQRADPEPEPRRGLSEYEITRVVDLLAQVERIVLREISNEGPQETRGG